MTVLTELAHHLQTLLTTEADQIARLTGCVRRARKLTGSTLVQTLVFGWLDNPRASLDDLTDVADDLGVDITPQSLDQRFTPEACQCLADLLAAALHRAVAAPPADIPLLRRFAGVYVFDTTTVSLPAALAEVFPGCGGHPGQGPAALKVHACLELTRGALDLSTGPGRQPDVSSALARGPLPPGALRLADRGFFDLAVLQEYTDAGVFWVTRLPCQVVVQGPDGEDVPLARWLAGQGRDAIDAAVKVGGGGRLEGRLVARRAPAAVVAKRLAQLQKRAKKKGRAVSAAQRALCGWTVYLTNLPAGQLSWEELWVLARARWLIELLFKLWKSHGAVDESRGEKPYRALGELYAKLLGQVVQHWVILTCGGPSVRYSYPKAAKRVRRKAASLVVVLRVPEELVRRLEGLRRRIDKCCGVQKRQGRPSACQLLLDPSLVRAQEEQQSGEATAFKAA